MTHDGLPEDAFDEVGVRGVHPTAVATRLRRYGFAVVVTLAALGVRLAFDGVLGDRQPYAAFFVAVLTTAWLAGAGPAVVALLLGYLLADWFFVLPRGSLSWLHPATADRIGDAVYLFVGGVVVALFEAMRRAAQRATERAELTAGVARRLRMATGAAGIGTWEQDVRTGDVTMSEEVRRAVGATRSVLGGAEWEALLHAEDVAALRQAREDAVAGRSEYAPEFRVARPDGELRWLATRATVVRNPSGAAARLVGVAFDVTERKRAEETQARLAAIVESSDDAIVGKTLDGIVVTWNAGAERLFGYPADEMIGRHISRIVPPERADDVRNILDAIRRGEPVQHYETERIRKDGKRVHVSLAVSPIKDAQGRIIGASKIARDVTDRKTTEALLRATQQRTRTLLDFTQAVMANMGEGLYTVDTRGRVTSVNPAAEQLFGWTSAELIGRQMHDVTHYARPDGTPFPAAECSGLRVLQSGTPLIDYEDVFIHKDGTFFPVVCSSAPIVSGDKTDGLVIVFRDVTQQKRAEAEREELLVASERARAGAEAASRAKDEFLSVVSHELRTPLSSMTNWLRVLRKSAAAVDERALAGLERAARSQSRLVDDLLDVSRIANGRLRLDTQPLDLRDVVAGALESVKPAADSKRVRIDTELGAVPVTVTGDADRLVQVAWNLLSNAVKFTPARGVVEARVAVVDGCARLTVRDSGVGIAPEFLPHVFQPFMQAEPASTRRHGGLGLGLAIVRRLVELHGGTVAVESAGPDQGATFTVALPVRPASVSDADEANHTAASSSA